VALNSVPPVTFWPAFILAITGFQIWDPGGGLKSGPYFQVFSSGIPLLTAPGGGVLMAPLSLPAGAARGNVICPAAALLAYGSADAGGAFCAWTATAPITTDKV